MIGTYHQLCTTCSEKVKVVISQDSFNGCDFKPTDEKDIRAKYDILATKGKREPHAIFQIEHPYYDPQQSLIDDSSPVLITNPPVVQVNANNKHMNWALLALAGVSIGSIYYYKKGGTKKSKKSKRKSKRLQLKPFK